MSDNPFEIFELGDDLPEQVEKATAKPSVPKKDPRICVCGHPARAHSSEGVTADAVEKRKYNQHVCRYARMACPCAKFIEVVKCDDVRLFTFRTSGIDANHALFKGVSRAKEKDVEFEWSDLSLTACVECGITTGPRHIVALNDRGRVSRDPGAFNVFLCQDHFIERGGAQV